MQLSSTTPLFLIVIVLINCFYDVKSTDYHECIGTSSECCIKRELFGGDKAILETKSGFNIGKWCNQVFIVRKTEKQYDACTGCTLSIEFVETNFQGSLELSEANYSSASYFTSETLTLEQLAEYDDPNSFPSGILRTTSTVLKFRYDSNVFESGTLKIIVTPNIPTSTVTLTVILSISIPLVIVFVIFNVVLYKLRQRRLSQIRTVLHSRLTNLVLDAEREARAHQRARQPHSPDPNDSIAPPSYTEAVPPPKYEDIVMVNSESCSPLPPAPNDAPLSYNDEFDLLPEDSAGPDNGRDADMLIV